MNPIKYCVMDNDNGPVAYVYTEANAKKIVEGLNLVNGIDPVQEMNHVGYCRFAYEAINQYKHDANLTLDLVSALVAGIKS